MCYLITMDLSKNPAAVARFRLRGFEVSENYNPHVRKAFGTTAKLVDVAKGGCSCSLYIERPASPDAVERHRYERRGWTQSKIERAIAQKHHAREHRGPTDRDSFFETLKQCVLAGGGISILVHSYSGLFSQEPVPSEKARELTFAELEAKCNLPCDTLLTFVGG